MSDVTVPAAEGRSVEVAGLKTSQEALIHGLIGAQYGDLEFDVGKSVRWTQWFVDDIFITDVNLGTPRYWIVNWTETFVEANHTVTGINYFVVPKDFRKQQFLDAMKHPNILLEPEDWVIFIDAHEALCIDTRPPLPNDAAIEPFRSYLYREIARANAVGKDRLVLPFYAFLKHDNVIVADYPSPAFADGALGFTTAQGSLGTPYYVANQGLTRMMKVKVLQNPAFDWGILDQPRTVDAGMNISIVSYGYAHWNMQDIVPPATTVAPLSEANDDGWRMRKLISMVRPIASIPYTEPYKTVAQDPAGLPGPWAPADPVTPDPIQAQPVTPHASLAGLLVGLYDNVIRLNLRDGVYYQGDENGTGLGNIPLKWDSVKQTWVPSSITTEDWHNTEEWVAPVS